MCVATSQAQKGCQGLNRDVRFDWRSPDCRCALSSRSGIVAIDSVVFSIRVSVPGPGRIVPMRVTTTARRLRDTRGGVSGDGKGRERGSTLSNWKKAFGDWSGRWTRGDSQPTATLTDPALTVGGTSTSTFSQSVTLSSGNLRSPLKAVSPAQWCIHCGP